MHLTELQLRHQEWAERNFPDSTSTDAFIGIVEEVGELGHAILKRKQGIRGPQEAHYLEMLDAIGDIMLYLTHFCNLEEIDLGKAVSTTLDTVLARDWTKYRNNGVTA